MWILNSFIFDIAICPTPFSLPTDLQSHTLSVFFFNPLRRWWSKLPNSCKFLRTNCHYILACIFENRTSFACYRPILTFNLCYTEAEPSLLFILEGGLFCLIVCPIIDPFIRFSASFVMKRIRSVIQMNFDIAVEDFSLSTYPSPYLEWYGFFDFLWSLKEDGGFPGRAWRAIA